MRKKEEIKKAEQECFDKVWYNRHCMLVQSGTFEERKTPEDIKKKAFAAANMLEEKYGDELVSMSDVDWGILLGKLSTLRWIMGDEWDNLDS
jgi:hypothetical protein